MTNTNENRTIIAFVCVQNAGRSQMATALAEQEIRNQDPSSEVVILSGGTHPADAPHPEVVEAMADIGIDISDAQPKSISDKTLETADIVITMGCSTLSLDGVKTRDWDLPNPAGADPAEVRAIRDEIQRLVRNLIEEFSHRE